MWNDYRLTSITMFHKFIRWQARVKELSSRFNSRNRQCLTERNNVEIFVVGTELVGLSKYTMDWRRLIQKVREVYGGKLTYAAEGWNAFKCL